MTELMDILARVMNIFDRVRSMEQLSAMAMAGFGIVLVFGVLNCILGYRLLRFWMMLGGFGVGAALGFFGAYSLEVKDKMVYGGAMLFGGVVLAVIVFLIYKAGVFILGAGIGWTLSIYIIHPTSSAVFFACILIGIGVGSLAVKYCREVLIVATSIIGGVMAGLALGRIGNLPEIPYGIGMSLGFALIGVLIQFAINKNDGEEDEDEEEDDYSGSDGSHRSHREESDSDAPEDLPEDDMTAERTRVQRMKRQERK